MAVNWGNEVRNPWVEKNPWKNDHSQRRSQLLRNAFDPNQNGEIDRKEAQNAMRLLVKASKRDPLLRDILRTPEDGGPNVFQQLSKIRQGGTSDEQQAFTFKSIKQAFELADSYYQDNPRYGMPNYNC